MQTDTRNGLIVGAVWGGAVVAQQAARDDFVFGRAISAFSFALICSYGIVRFLRWYRKR